MTNEEIDRIVFTERELTVGEMRLLKRLEAWDTARDWEAFCGLLLLRSNLTADQINGIGISQIDRVIGRLLLALARANEQTLALKRAFNVVDTVVDKIIQGKPH